MRRRLSPRSLVVTVAILFFGIVLFKLYKGNSKAQEPGEKVPANITTETEWWPFDYGDMSIQERQTTLMEKGIAADKFLHQRIAPKRLHWECYSPQTPPDIARIELRFFNGKERLAVHGLTIRQIVRDGSKHLAGQYCTAVGFTSSEWEGEKVLGAYSCSFPLLSDSAPKRGDNLYLGHRYLVKIELPKPNPFGDSLGKMILDVPKEVEKGKDLVVRVDTARCKNMNEINAILNDMKRLTIRVDQQFERKFFARFWDPVKKMETTPRFSPKGVARSHVFNLPGELSIIDPGGYARFHIHQTQSPEVVLPRDADYICRPEDLVHIQLDIPLDQMPKAKLREVCLFLRKDDVFSIAWGNPWKKRGGKPERLKSVPIRCKPGDYAVKYYIEGKECAARHLGRIRVDSKGKVKWLKRAWVE